MGTFVYRSVILSGLHAKNPVKIQHFPAPPSLKGFTKVW